jgi:hypothetical protein
VLQRLDHCRSSGPFWRFASIWRKAVMDPLSCAARPALAGVPFGLSSAEAGKAAPTFGAGPDASMVVCGATFGRVASQSSRAILIGSIRAVFHQSGNRKLHRPPSRRQTGPVESEPSMPGFWCCADDCAEVRHEAGRAPRRRLRASLRHLFAEPSGENIA